MEPSELPADSLPIHALLGSSDESRPRDVGQNGEITRLMMKHRARVYGYILACVRNHNDAEEVFQEVSVGVITSFHKLRDAEEFLPWAIEISRRQVLSFCRRSRRPIVYDSELVGVLAEAAERQDLSEAAERRGRVLGACLEKLPTKSREVLRMRYCDSFSSVDEIAAYLGRSMAATYGVLKRIRLALRKCLDEQFPIEAKE